MAVEKRAKAEATKQSDASTPGRRAEPVCINVEVGELDEAASLCRSSRLVVMRKLAHAVTTRVSVTLQVVDVLQAHAAPALARSTLW